MAKFLLFLIVLFIAIASYVAHDIHRYVNNSINASNQDIEITIDRGASFTDVSEQLQQAGLIDKPLYFKLLAKFEEKTQQIKSGEYIFNTSLSPAQILDDLVKGNTKLYKITVIEGKRFKDFLLLLDENDKIEHTIQDQEQIKQALEIEQKSLEGLFLPETYTFAAGTKDIDILRQSYTLLRDFLDEEWPKRSENSYVKTPYEALILASIVEKETSAPEERARIAGVFISRLQIQMPLQTDPTVIYGIGDEFDGDITRKHLQTDTPYNTYTRRGLPPSPICLVGKESIEAVLHPDITGELFFVSKKDGTHYFSKTYEEHREAVRKYQLGK
ncbi:MAG: endolytic transglycosylase MltG [Pseudomonadota bacterium]